MNKATTIPEYSCLPRLDADYRKHSGTCAAVVQPLHAVFAFGSLQPPPSLAGSQGCLCLLPQG